MLSVDLSENSKNINIRFFYGNTVCCGTAINLTAVDMIIHSRTCYPMNSIFNILFLLNDKVMEIPVKVKGLLKTDPFSHSMAVEIMSINSSYLNLLNSIIPEDVRIKSTDKTRKKVFA
jgi:hypothetical protein